MSNAKLTPDYLFEVSWEVCNKVGGIHTVISTKAQTVTRKFADRYILIGPDLQHEGANPEFEEDPDMLKAWRQSVYSDGLRIRVGHWKIKGEPTVILVDFTSLIPRKDEILKKLWETYHVDSLSGQWDYIEPVLFGYAAGMVIASYVDNFCNATDKIAAHFHEWMTAAGGLHLRKHAPYVATLFTTHATVMGNWRASSTSWPNTRSRRSPPHTTTPSSRSATSRPTNANTCWGVNRTASPPTGSKTTSYGRARSTTPNVPKPARR